MFIPPIHMRVTFPRLNMTVTLPEVRVDVGSALQDIGLKPMGRVVREAAAKGVALGNEGIARMVQEGDRLARVEESANAIAEIAAEKWPRPRELNVDVAPKHRPHIQLKPGELALQLRPGRVEVRLPSVTGRFIDLQA